MNRVLSLLLLVPFLITQVLTVTPAFARGGPYDDMLSKSASALAGTYGVALMGEYAWQTSADNPTNEAHINASNVTGVVAMSLPATGMASARVLLFKEGLMYMGIAQGITDPRSGKVQLLSQLSHYFYRAGTDGITATKELMVIDSVYSGQINLELKVDYFSGIIEAIGDARFSEYDPLMSSTTTTTQTTTTTNSPSAGATIAASGVTGIISGNITTSGTTTTTSSAGVSGGSVGTGASVVQTASNQTGVQGFMTVIPGPGVSMPNSAVTATATEASKLTASGSLTTTGSSTGTVTTNLGAPGTVSFSNQISPSTLSAITLNGGSTFVTPGAVTTTNKTDSTFFNNATQRSGDTKNTAKQLGLYLTANGVRQSTDVTTINAFTIPTAPTSFQVGFPAAQ